MIKLIKDMDIEQLAVDGHVPKLDAVYIIADLDNGDFYEISTEDVKKDSEMLTKDYFSQLISINKSVDRKKQIQSNNKYTIFTKKPEELTTERLADYYNALECPEPEQQIYISWFSHNKEALSAYSGKLVKVFFPAPAEAYKVEGEKYFKSRVFTDMQNTVTVGGVEMGAPLTINANYKKPFLLSNPTKVKFPTIHTAEDCYKIKCLLDVFKNFLRSGYDKVYLVDGKFIPVKYGTILNKRITGAVFFRFMFNDRGEVVITDWQSVPAFDADFGSKNIVYYYININNLFFDGDLYNIFENGINNKTKNAREANALMDKLREWFLLGRFPDYISLKFIIKHLAQITKNDLGIDYENDIKKNYFLKELNKLNI